MHKLFFIFLLKNVSFKIFCNSKTPSINPYSISNSAFLSFIIEYGIIGGNGFLYRFQVEAIGWRKQWSG
jgi:hypothetical protein